MFLVILLYALFASVFTIAKVGLEVTTPLFLVGTRMFLAGVLLLSYQLIRFPETLSLKKINFLLVGKLALFNIYFTNVLEFWGLQYLPSFKACFIYSLSPFLSALFSYFIFAEKLSKNKWIGLTIGFVGFIPLLLSQTSGETADQLLFISWPEAAVIGAAVSSVYGWILLKQLINEHQCPPMLANGLSMFLGGGMALFHSFLTENWTPFPVTNYPSFIECTLLLMIVSNIICYNLYGALLKKYSATFMSFAGFTTPLFTAFFGWFFLSESVSWQFFLSVSIVVSGLSLFYKEELKSGAMTRLKETNS